MSFEIRRFVMLTAVFGAINCDLFCPIEENVRMVKSLVEALRRDDGVISFREWSLPKSRVWVQLYKCRSELIKHMNDFSILATQSYDVLTFERFKKFKMLVFLVFSIEGESLRTISNLIVDICCAVKNCKRQEYLINQMISQVQADQFQRQLEMEFDGNPIKMNFFSFNYDPSDPCRAVDQLFAL